MQGGLRPHAYCLPILKREEHRQAVLGAATSGSPKFFLGTDSAPHPKTAKVSWSSVCTKWLCDFLKFWPLLAGREGRPNGDLTSCDVRHAPSIA